jgi:hypothetical protein
MMRALVPALAGALLAAAVSLGLVFSQTNEPDTNPANEPILTYGQPAT